MPKLAPLLLAPAVLLCLGAAPWAETAQRIRQQNAQKSPAQSTSSSSSTVSDPRLALARKVARINYDNVAFTDVIDAFRDQAGANIHVNWKALEAIGIDKRAPVSVHLSNISLHKVLKTIVKDLGGTDNLLTFYIDEGVIEVTTREIADRQLITRVYPVGDLVMQVPNFAGPNVQLSNVGQGGGGRTGGGGNTSLFSDSNSNDTGAQNEQPKTRQQAADELVALIKETVTPDLWRENGGTASMAYFNGYLVVTAPRSVHEQLGGNPD